MSKHLNKNKKKINNIIKIANFNNIMLHNNYLVTL
jgi:hypothetical protein